jgi:hypothetical protein
VRSGERKLIEDIEAGISKEEAEKVVRDQDEGLQEAKMKIQEQTSNGVDLVPFVVLEGKRMDVTIQDYVKAMEKIVKERS